MKRLDIDDPQCWNKWRELYDSLTDEEHAQFLNDSESRYPSQKSFTFSNYEFLFDKLSKSPIRKSFDEYDFSILEVGGWKGELAHQCFTRFGRLIKSWHNIDMCYEAIRKTVAMPFNYTTFCPKEFAWFSEKKPQFADAFIAAHTIEHLSDRHLWQLLDFVAGIPYVILEAPISEHGNAWDDYVGTHILKAGWAQIRTYMIQKGYRSQQLNDSCAFFVMNWIEEL
jgi:hypothetical protein